MDNEKIDGLSMDIAAVEQDKLRAVFPQCFVEGKLDERKLLELLGTFDTIDENDREKYEFRWKGKQEARQLAGKRSAGTLRPCRPESVDWENTRNLYIEGDNLEVLKLLQTSYYRKVKMIYIDPPYNTGNDFVYDDDFADPLRRYREVTQQTTKSNPESMGRFHTNWLNMMLPRLHLAANLLRDDGVIFISIDDNEVHNLRKLCDEVFGEENFIAELIWKSKSGGANDSRFFAVDHEYVICYARNANVFKLFFDKEAVVTTSYNQQDENGRYSLDRLDKQSIRYSASLDYEIKDEQGNSYFPKHKDPAIPNATWRWGKETVRERFSELVFKDGNVYTKNYEKEGAIARSLLLEDRFGRTRTGKTDCFELFNRVLFDNPKPYKLVRYLLNIVSADDDIILDFFSGSATTAHAVMQLNAEDGGNRRFILVQLPEVCDENSEAAKAGYANICEIGKERIRRAGKKITEQYAQITLDDRLPPDTGFRVFKLDSSNLKLWDDSPITGDNAVAELEQRLTGMLEILKPDRTDTDVVYEVMLKLGQDLYQPVIPIDIGGGRQVYGICEDVKIMICLAPDITEAEAQIMAEYGPGRIVFTDRCFNNSTDKSNVKLSLRDRGITIRVL